MRHAKSEDVVYKVNARGGRSLILNTHTAIHLYDPQRTSIAIKANHLGIINKLYLLHLGNYDITLLCK